VGVIVFAVGTVIAVIALGGWLFDRRRQAKGQRY